MIHFWLPQDPDAELADWDPDAEPARYASGVGHNMLEPYVRLARLGEAVSIGPEPGPRSRLIVVYGKSVYQSRDALRALLRVGHRAAGRFALIRSDTQLAWSLPVRPAVEFMPTRGSVEHRWQRWVPPLPQRGLVPRARSRRGRIATVAFKGNPENVPPDFGTEGWRQSLAERDLKWILDTPSRTDGSDQRWHDFGDVDVVLCVRGAAWGWDIGRKPATRLINAWLAGCIPVAQREPSYAELGRNEEDVVFVDGPLDSLAAIDRLLADSSLVDELERRIDDRAAAFRPEVVLEQWRVALLSAAESQPRWQIRTARLYAGRLATARRLDPVLRLITSLTMPARVRAARLRNRLRAKPAVR